MRCESSASKEYGSIVTLPVSPSMKMITSSAALPWISSASKPENFRNGAKYPPTLLSITFSVSGLERHHRGFAGAGIGRDPADGTVGNDQFILRVIPFGLRRDCIPQQFETKAAPAGEQILHLLGDRFFVDGVVVQIDVERAVGIAALHGAKFIGEFCKQSRFSWQSHGSSPCVRSSNVVNQAMDIAKHVTLNYPNFDLDCLLTIFPFC